jgi:hypothetical protein
VWLTARGIAILFYTLVCRQIIGEVLCPFQAYSCPGKTKANEIYWAVSSFVFLREEAANRELTHRLRSFRDVALRPLLSLLRFCFGIDLGLQVMNRLP